MKSVLALALSVFLLAGCSEAKKVSNEGSVPAQQILEDKELIKGILKPLSRRNVEVKRVELVKGLNVPGFVTFKVTLLDKDRNVEIKKYIWMSRDGNYLVLDMFAVKKEGKKILIEPLSPKERIKQLPPKKVNLSWVKKIDQQLTKEGIPHVIGKGDKKVYVIWDVYCPFCYEHLKKLSSEELSKKGIELHMIPFPIHGERSITGTVYFFKLSKEKGFEGAINYITDLGGGDFRKYVEEFEKESEKYVKSLSPEERKKEEEFAKSLKDELVKYKVRGTPTIVYIPQNSQNNEGYKFLGYKPLDEVVKLK